MCNTFFQQKLFCVLIGESFSKKELEFFSFRKRLGFLVKKIYFFVLVCFCCFFCFGHFSKD